MKDATRSTNLKPVGDELAGNCGIALHLNGTLVCHQDTVKDGTTAERNSLAGSDNIEQNLVPLHSDQVDMRIAAQREFFVHVDDKRSGRGSLEGKGTVVPKNKIFQT